MDFNHSDDRQMLADTLRRFLADRYGFEARQKIAASDEGHSPERWRELAELGVIGALFDEASGGFGGAGWDIMVVFHALGQALAVEPFLGALMAGRALALAGGQDEALAGIIAGETMAAFAHHEPQGRYDLAAVTTAARRDGANWRLDGAKAVVAQAEAAGLFVVSAMADGKMALFTVAKDAGGLAVRGYRTIDGGRAGELTLADTPATLIAADAADLIERTVAAGIVALCAESLGAMEAARDATLAYLQTRVQFGTVIGKFQALQHRMADLLIEVEQARSAVINAAAALDGDDRLARERAVSAAKYTIGRVGTLVAEESIQMHGGIGMTWELPLAHYAKRLVMIDHQLGDEDHHLARYIELGRAA